MFRSTYGFIPGGDPQEAQWRLDFRAIDFDRGVEVLAVGGIHGEDVPFSGTIYVIRTSRYLVPFIAHSARGIAELSMSQFDHGKWAGWRFPRNGKIPVVVVPVSHVGADCAAICTGPRSMLSYDKRFPVGEGYRFKNEAEKTEVCALIREALPVLAFDDYQLALDPRPAICVGVELEGEKYQADEGPQEAAMRVVRRLAADDSHRLLSEGFVPAMKKLGQRLTLERLIAEFLALERIMFTRGGDSYPHLVQTQEALELVAACYRNETGDRPPYERYIASVACVLSERVLCRKLFERGIVCSSVARD